MQSGKRVEKIEKPMRMVDKSLIQKRSEMRKRMKVNRKRVKGVQRSIDAGNFRVIPHDA